MYIYLYDSQIVHHDPGFNLFILDNNSFDNQGSEINKSDIFYVSTYCLLQKLSFHFLIPMYNIYIYIYIIYNILFCEGYQQQQLIVINLSLLDPLLYLC